MSKSRSGPKVALIVTNETPESALVEMLRLTGYQVRVESSAQGALLALLDVVPQLAFLGALDDLDGLPELLAELKASCKAVVVASDDDAMVSLAERLGLLVRASPPVST